jgi:ribosome-associated heat shock protein Hsp15
MKETEKLRLDKYLWSIRIFKTRAMAAAACDKGKVRHMGGPAKASKKVSVNDEYEIKSDARKWVIRVTGLLDQRVQFSEAVKFYLDLTPAEEIEKLKFRAASFHTGKRLSKVGRPTKKDKRDLEDFLDSGENPN